MIKQRVYIPSADWYVSIFYDAKPKDAIRIIDALYNLGCPSYNLHKAERLLKSGIPNEGLTYSNESYKESIIVVGHVSCPLQLCNTLLHELDHLQVAICKAYGIRTDGEDAAYLMGDISEAIARNAWMVMRKIFLFLL